MFTFSHEHQPLSAKPYALNKPSMQKRRDLIIAFLIYAANIITGFLHSAEVKFHSKLMSYA